MSVHLAAGAMSAVVGAAGGLAVPALIRRVPEPPPEEATPEEDVDPTDVVAAFERAEGPKAPYVDVAAWPALQLVATLVGLVGGALIGGAVGLDLLLVALLPALVLGIALSVIDFRTRLLPTPLVRPLYAVGIVVVVVADLVRGDLHALERAGVGLVVCFVFYFVLWFVYPRGMGYGDVKLAGALGLLLAQLGWAQLLVGVYAGFLVFGLPGVTVAIVKRDRKLLKKPYPFGPFMFIGALIGIVAGAPIASGLGW